MVIVMDEHDKPRKSLQEVIGDYGSQQLYFIYYKYSFVQREDRWILCFPNFDNSTPCASDSRGLPTYLSTYLCHTNNDTEVLCIPFVW